MFILLLWDRAFLGKRNEPKSGSRIKRLFGWGIFLTVVWGGLATAATLPAGTVTVVSTTSPVVRSTPGIAITANVSATFDSNSTPVVTTSCNACNNGNNFCGTGTSGAKSQQVITSSSTTVGDMTMIVKASPEFGMANPTNTVLTGPTLRGNGSGTYSGVLPAPKTGADGDHSIIVTAYLSESVANVVTTTTNMMSGGGCNGNVVSSTSSTQSSTNSMRFGTASGTGTYFLNINPPALSFQADSSQAQVKQGNNHIVHNVLTGGVEQSSYTVADTITGPAGYTSTATASGTFSRSAQGTGVAVGVHIACDAPLGAYSTTSSVQAVDLATVPFDPVIATDATPFVVNAGLFVEDQTLVVSESPVDGSYAPVSCFSATPSGRSVNTTPGSFYIAATVNTSGPCAGFSSMNNAMVSLTLPPDFALLNNGASGKAHVFLGPAAKGFDLRDPQTLTDVTPRLPKAAITSSGQTITVDLSQLDMGFGPGVLPSNYTIYIRTHTAYASDSIPADGTPYVFTTSTTTTLPGIGAVTNASSKNITASPACLNGN